MLRDATDWDCYPANDTHLRLYDASRQKDFLVVYNEMSERRKKIRERAYFLYQNENRVQLQQRPVFVSAKLADNLTAVPVIQSPEAATNFPTGLFVVTTNITSFTIYSNQSPVMACNLPWYGDPMGKREQMFLSPIAVVIDGVIVAVVIAGVVFCYVYGNQPNWP